MTDENLPAKIVDDGLIVPPDGFEMPKIPTTAMDFIMEWSKLQAKLEELWMKPSIVAKPDTRIKCAKEMGNCLKMIYNLVEAAKKESGIGQNAKIDIKKLISQDPQKALELITAQRKALEKLEAKIGGDDS